MPAPSFLTRHLRSFIAGCFAFVLASQFFPAAAAERLSDLERKIKALPETTISEKTKKAVLAVALERASACLDAKMPGDANALAADIAAALRESPTHFGAENKAAANIGAIGPVIVSKGNPFIDRMVAGATGEMAKPDQPWPKVTRENPVFKEINGPYGARRTASAMEAWWWLYANPASPLRGNPEVLKRLLHRYFAYVDAIQVIGPKTKHGAVIFDDFAIGPASAVLREVPALYPGLLLPGQKKALDEAMRFTGSQIFNAAKPREGNYANIDVAIGCELLNFGLYLKDQPMLDKARELIYAQEKNQLPDGGFHYIWSQNESAGYHGTVTSYLTRYFEITGDKKVAEMVRNSQWHGPVSGRLIDFWTCPSWKGTWNQNSGSAVGCVSVAALSGNPFVRGMLDRENRATGDWTGLARSARWYRNDIAPRELPDDYTAPDRDIAGVRAWYGPFTYAATLRDIPEKEPGLSTIMGAQILTPDSHFKQALMGVNARVRIGAEGFKGTEFNSRAWAWLTSGLKGACIVGRHFSATGATYQLHAFGSSTKGPLANWTGTQVWIGLPDRVIGLVNVRPKSVPAEAYEVNGVVRLCYGGTALGTPAKLVSSGTNRYRYGDLEVVIHQSNYSKIDPVEVPFRRPNAPVSELTLREPAGIGNAANKPLQYKEAGDFTFVVEIRSPAVKDEATVNEKILPGRVVELAANVGGKSCTVWFNAGEQPQNIVLPPASDRKIPASLRLSGTANAPVTSIPASITLAPAQQAALVVSSSAEDHLPGWNSFSEMISSTQNDSAGKKP